MEFLWPAHHNSLLNIHIWSLIKSQLTNDLIILPVQLWLWQTNGRSCKLSHRLNNKLMLSFVMKMDKTFIERRSMSVEQPKCDLGRTSTHYMGHHNLLEVPSTSAHISSCTFSSVVFPSWKFIKKFTLKNSSASALSLGKLSPVYSKEPIWMYIPVYHSG